MNLNYKFSRRLEMSCFNKSEIRDFIIDHYRPEKKQMIDEDLGTPDTQANVTFYTYSGVEMLKITTRDVKSRKMKPSGFMSVLKGVYKKHQRLLLQEIKEYEAWKKQQEKEQED
jgi:hypothetical protein